MHGPFLQKRPRLSGYATMWWAQHEVQPVRNISYKEKSDYILFRQIDSKGMNIGLKYENRYFMPFTNLISKSSCLDEYISSTTPKIVYKLIVSSIDTGETEEEIIYTDNFIFHK